MLASASMLPDPSSPLPPLLAVHELTVRFRKKEAQAAEAPAVKNLSFTIAQGESLGLVGESGSGKSVTALSVLRLLPGAAAQTTGQIRYTAPSGAAQDLLTLPEGSMRSLRGREIAMIFQEPMTALNPVMTVGAQLEEALRAHIGSLNRRQVRERVHEAMETVALPDPVRRSGDYPHQFSGGQRQRILIAMAILHKPRLLIADEPTTALDVTVQAQILELLQRLREEYGLAMLFISHDLAVVSQVADRVAVMRGGVLLEQAPVRTLFRDPVHPYTQALLRAIPTMSTPLGEPLATVRAAPGWREGVLREHTAGHWVRDLG